MLPAHSPTSSSAASHPFVIRQKWYDEIVRRLQAVEGGALLVDPDDAQLTLERLGRELPEPQTHLERLLLRGLLLEVACRCGHRLHRQKCDGRTACNFTEASILEKFFGDRTPDPRQPFLRWVQQFFGEFARVHPQSAARKLARRLRRSCGEHLDLAACAASLNMGPAQLRRAFFREFGQSIREYQRCARIMAALEMAGSANVARIALEVGYKSKKNFYRAFTRLTGTTPAAFRRLTPVKRHEIVESARLALTNRK
jgi:AraC-like DNA-binding protein